MYLLVFSSKEDIGYFSACLGNMENPATILDIEDDTLFIFKRILHIPEYLCRTVFSACRLASLFCNT
jgi:hypothetical protein